VGQRSGIAALMSDSTEPWLGLDRDVAERDDADRLALLDHREPADVLRPHLPHGVLHGVPVGANVEMSGVNACSTVAVVGSSPSAVARIARSRSVRMPARGPPRRPR
jgi:rhodanese-related sulfurtransferase